MYQSLARWSSPFRLWVLCLDDDTYRFFERNPLPEVIPISLQEVETCNPRLLAVKHTRTRLEYYFTCTPQLPLFVFQKYPNVQEITYLDADLYFFSSSAPIFDEQADASITIIGHRFPPHLAYMRKWGIYNVQFLTFKRNAEGLSCLERWAEQCLEWCYDRLEDGRFADQKYLDPWPQLYPGAHVVTHPGAGVAPWNLDLEVINISHDQIMINNQSLIFFHFHHLREWGRSLVELGLANYHVSVSRDILKALYLPYIRQLKDLKRDVASMYGSQHFKEGKVLPRYNLTSLARALIHHDLLVQFGSRVFW